MATPLLMNYAVIQQSDIDGKEVERRGINYRNLEKIFSSIGGLQMK